MNYITIYRKAFNIGDQDIAFCEVCGSVAVDVHHIELKGMGGNPDADCIENLIGLCRHHHDVAHGKVAGEELTRETLFNIVEKRS